MRRLVALALLATATVALCAEPANKTLPWLGMRVRALADRSGHRVLHVEGITPAGPAERAGIRLGDIIVELGDNSLQVGDELDFLMFLAQHKPNDRIRVKLVRHGILSSVVATFAEMPASGRLTWDQSIDYARHKRASTQNH